MSDPKSKDKKVIQNPKDPAIQKDKSEPLQTPKDPCINPPKQESDKTQF